MVVISNFSLFCAIQVSNLSMSCVIVASLILSTSDLVIRSFNGNSSITRSSTRLPQLVSFLSEFGSNSCVNKVPRSDVFLSHAAKRSYSSLNGGIPTARRTSCFRLSTGTTSWGLTSVFTGPYFYIYYLHLFFFCSAHPTLESRSRDQFVRQQLLFSRVAKLVLEPGRKLHGSLLSVSSELLRRLSFVEVDIPLR